MINNLPNALFIRRRWMRDRKYALILIGIMLLFLAVACSNTNEPKPPAQPAQPAPPAASGPTGTATPTPGGPEGTKPAGTGAPVTAAAAKPIFEKNCIPCHGADGKGNKKISPKMPDFTDAEWHKTHNDEELDAAIHNGIGTGKG